MQSSNSIAVKLMAVLFILLIGGCAGSSSHMRDIPPEQANYTTQADKALVVFMRPSGFGFAIQSSVFDIADGNPEFIGVVSAKTKVAHYVEPGKRRFMVVGESADFMDATLDTNKVYYALVRPRLGVWKARFSFKPIHRAELQGDEFADWYDDTRWVENSETASNWARSNKESILDKMNDDLPDWQEKSEKPALIPSDGQDELPQSTN